MTTIAYRDGILAADSCETTENEDSGTYKNRCEKMFRVGPFIVALQGDSTPGMVWLQWFRSAYALAPATADAATQRIGKIGGASDDECRKFNQHFAVPQNVPPETADRLLASGAEFTAVVLTPGGRLFEYDAWGVAMTVTAPYYAVGSGAKAALGAMAHGANAFEAVMAACEHDPYTSAPVHSSESL